MNGRGGGGWGLGAGGGRVAHLPQFHPPPLCHPPISPLHDNPYAFFFSSPGRQASCAASTAGAPRASSPPGRGGLCRGSRGRSEHARHLRGGGTAESPPRGYGGRTAVGGQQTTTKHDQNESLTFLSHISHSQVFSPPTHPFLPYIAPHFSPYLALYSCFFHTYH